jgi:hypothetical protein
MGLLIDMSATNRKIITQCRPYENAKKDLLLEKSLLARE